MKGRGKQCKQGCYGQMETMWRVIMLCAGGSHQATPSVPLLLRQPAGGGVIRIGPYWPSSGSDGPGSSTKWAATCNCGPVPALRVFWLAATAVEPVPALRVVQLAATAGEWAVAARASELGRQCCQRRLGLLQRNGHPRGFEMSPGGSVGQRGRPKRATPNQV